MEQFQIAIPWLQKILPEGIPIPSSTIITGPGGAGKPLIGAMLQSRENYLFTIANNTFEKQVAEWESLADNLFFTLGTGIMHLGFKVLKLHSSRFSKEEIGVPLTEDELYTMHSEADTARKHLIPIIRKI